MKIMELMWGSQEKTGLIHPIGDYEIHSTHGKCHKNLDQQQVSDGHKLTV